MSTFHCRRSVWLLFVAGCSSLPDMDETTLIPDPSATPASTPAPASAPSATATVPITTPPPPIIVSTAAPPPTTSSPPVPTAPPTLPEASPPEELPALFADPPRHAERAVPIVGGTLIVTADGATAVAADPDRDLIYLVDLAARSVRTVPAEPGDEPGRLVEGPTGIVYVTARGAGAVLSVDLATASVSARIPVCGAPRGLAYDATSGQLHVACRSGVLASIDTARSEVIARRELEEDLRDVIVRGESLVVTRFRSAEVLTLDASANVTERMRPPLSAGFTSSVAFRALAAPSGAILLVHQVESDAPLGTGFGAYYGGNCFGGGVVQQALTSLPAPGVTPITGVLPTLTGPTDLAVSRDGARVAVLASGNSWPAKQELPTLFVGSIDENGEPSRTFLNTPCQGDASQARYLAGEPVAVAFDAAGKYLVQSREPAMLELEGDVFIPLSDDSRFDSGLATFYLNTGGNVSCASCHPDGTDDGHIWAFSSVGYRRTQSLAGGISTSAPFHWSGDLPNFESLFAEVMLGRMALPFVPPREHVAGLATWLDTLPREAPSDLLDAGAVERGKQLFSDATRACTVCHSGPTLSDGRTHDVGSGGTFVTPSLLGVAQRLPLMHDGCATTLRARFGACGGTEHGDTSALSEAQIEDLVAYLRSL